MRKFLERCGFKLEAVLRKHRIVDSRNSDTALYVILNSEWPDTEIKLKKLLGLDLRPKMQKAFEIDKPSAVVVSTNKAASNRGAPAGNSAGNGSTVSSGYHTNTADTAEVVLSKSQKARMRKKRSKDRDTTGQ
jgi:hypothetical protein